MDIYWIKDKHRCGPATVPDVISLVQMGEISPDTPGWHAGCKGWMPLRSLPALSDFLDELREPSADEHRDSEDSPEEDEARDSEPLRRPGGDDFAGADGGDFSAFGEGSKEPGKRSEAGAERRHDAAEPQSSGRSDEPALPPLPPDDLASILGEHPRRVYLPSPGARFMARMVDYALYMIVAYLIIFNLGIEYDKRLLPGSFYIWIPCLLLEGILLSSFGTTPGKALMGIRMSIFGEAEKLSVLRATTRSALVFALGCGLMIFPLIPLTGLLALWRLRRRGITGWDAGCSTIPVQVKPATTERMLLGFTILFGAFMSMSVLLMPWMPSMLEDLETQRPGSTQVLSTLIGAPEETPQASPRPRSTPSPTSENAAESESMGFSPRPGALSPSTSSALVPLPSFSTPSAASAPNTSAPSAEPDEQRGSVPSPLVREAGEPARPDAAPAAQSSPATAPSTPSTPQQEAEPSMPAGREPSASPQAPPAQPAAQLPAGLPASPGIG